MLAKAEKAVAAAEKAKQPPCKKGRPRKAAALVEADSAAMDVDDASHKAAKGSPNKAPTKRQRTRAAKAPAAADDSLDTKENPKTDAGSSKMIPAQVGAQAGDQKKPRANRRAEKLEKLQRFAKALAENAKKEEELEKESEKESEKASEKEEEKEEEKNDEHDKPSGPAASVPGEVAPVKEKSAAELKRMSKAKLGLQKLFDNLNSKDAKEMGVPGPAFAKMSWTAPAPHLSASNIGIILYSETFYVTKNAKLPDYLQTALQALHAPMWATSYHTMFKMLYILRRERDIDK